MTHHSDFNDPYCDTCKAARRAEGEHEPVKAPRTEAGRAFVATVRQAVLDPEIAKMLGADGRQQLLALVSPDAIETALAEAEAEAVDEWLNSEGGHKAVGLIVDAWLRSPEAERRMAEAITDARPETWMATAFARAILAALRGESA